MISILYLCGPRNLKRCWATSWALSESSKTSASDSTLSLVVAVVCLFGHMKGSAHICVCFTVFLPWRRWLESSASPLCPLSDSVFYWCHEPILWPGWGARSKAPSPPEQKTFSLFSLVLDLCLPWRALLGYSRIWPRGCLASVLCEQIRIPKQWAESQEPSKIWQQLPGLWIRQQKYFSISVG